MTDLTERAADLCAPGVLPGVADRDERPPAEPAATPPEGVALSRLLSLVRLTAPQAVEVAAGVLAEAVGRASPGTRSSDGDAVGPDQVMISADGRVVLGPAPDGDPSGKPRALGAPLAGLLADVAGAARVRGRPADPAAEQLLAVLDRALTELPDAGVGAAAGMLQEAAAGIDRGVVRAELAALVRAVRGRTAGARGPAPAGRPSTAVRTPPARRATTGTAKTAMRRTGAWLLSVLLLAAVVVLEVVFLRDDITADVHLLLDAGRSGSSSATAPRPDGLPIVPPAPAAAGTVTGVDLRPLVQCAPAAPCTLRLLVRLAPGPDARPVTWSYRIIDRCTGATSTVPGGTVTVPAGGQRFAAVGTVSLPALQAVAVVAVTELPAAAASSPVLAGSCLAAGHTG